MNNDTASYESHLNPWSTEGSVWVGTQMCKNKRISLEMGLELKTIIFVKLNCSGKVQNSINKHLFS